jgi:hypothetical protein
MKSSLIREAWGQFRSYCGLDGFAISHSRQRARVCRWGALACSYSGAIVRWREDYAGIVYKTVQGRPCSFSRARRYVRSVCRTNSKHAISCSREGTR